MKRLPVALMILLTMPVLGIGEEHYNNRPVSFWIKALASRDAIVRTNAATALGKLGPSGRTGVDALIGAVDDKSIDVRVAAIKALGQIGPDAAPSVPRLARLLENDSDAVNLDLAKQAAAALAKIEANGAGPLIAALLNANAFPANVRTTIDDRALERLSAALKDQRSPVKLAAAVKGTGQLFSRAFTDKKVDKLADVIEVQLKRIQDNPKYKGLDEATPTPATQTVQAIKETQQVIRDYREQVPIRFDSFKNLLEADPEQWKKVVKLLAASDPGMNVLAMVVAEHPESQIASLILKEW